MTSDKRKYWLGLMGLSLVSGCTASSSVDDLPKPFSHAVAMRDCAPWDGAAMSILLTTEAVNSSSVIPSPLLRLSIWRSPDVLQNVTIQWPDDPVEAAASWCDNDNTCEAASSGMVRFREVKVESLATGEFRLAFANRDSVIGGFRARWLHRRVLCG